MYDYTATNEISSSENRIFTPISKGVGAKKRDVQADAGPFNPWNGENFAKYNGVVVGREIRGKGKAFHLYRGEGASKPSQF